MAEPLSVADVRAAVESLEQLRAVLSEPRVTLVYLDEACFPDDAFADGFRKIHAAGKQAGLRLRRVERSTDGGLSSGDLLQKIWEAPEPYRPDTLLIRSMDEVEIVREFIENLSQREMPKPEIVYDYTVYGYNLEAVKMLLDLGAERLTAPIELNAHELRALRRSREELRIPGTGKAPTYELVVYGHLPMMVSANCIRKTSAGCDHANRILKLRDRMQKNMPVRCYCKYCYNQIFNAEPMVLYDLGSRLPLLPKDSIRYDFSVEGSAEVHRILAGYLPEKLTRAHFTHGVD